MVDWWELLADILIIAVPLAVPAVIGAFASKYIINSWQVKKEEFNLKKDQYALRKQILGDFENSYVAELSVLEKFVTKITDYYTNNYTLVSEEKKNITFSMTFPKGGTEHPLKKFSNEYDEFKKEKSKIDDIKWKFFSTIRIYYNLGDIEEHMVKISGASSFATQMTHVYIYSKTEEEFHKNYDIAYKAFNSLREANHVLGHLLANKKMRKPPE